MPIIPATIDLFDTYTMAALVQEVIPEASFFRDRYFPSSADDIFNSEKVLTEYRKGDRRMAAFCSPRMGDIPVDRLGFEMGELAPAYIAPSRILTIDDLQKRGFGEALYANTTQAERAARIQVNDYTDLDRMITRREEWMAVQTMIHNACTMQEYADGATEGRKLYVKFFDEKTEHTYTASQKWTSWEIMRSDVTAMCEMLSNRGLPAEDLVIGSKVAAEIRKFPELKELLNTTSGILTGRIDEKRTKYPGVVLMGTLNFEGFLLDVYIANETYVNEAGKVQKYFPETSAMVAAPNSGHLMYGSVTQIDYGSDRYSTYAGKRIPKLVVDQANDMRKVRLACRPLAAPNNYCPWTYAAEVVA